MAGKYTPLENFLRNTLATEREVALTFEQIERILNSKLPESANELSWWEHETEGNHVNTRAWANAGWRVAEVNFDEKRVRFVRE
jgi:hypothetical protein